MAIETHVFFDAKPPAARELNARLKGLGLPVVIRRGSGALDQHAGFLPVNIERRQTGCELDFYSGPDGTDGLEAVEGVSRFPHRASLRWASDPDEAVAGRCLAAALASSTGGVVFDEELDRLLSADEAVAYARQHLKAKSPVRRVAEPGTRPADIKRYLKAILEQRNDLALFGRALVIRPVRHLLRGAFLDRTGDRSAFQIWRYLKPLYSHPATLGCDDPIHGSLWNVKAAHFIPLLYDALRHDVFAELAPVATFSGLAARLMEDREKLTDCVTALVLSGRHEEASAYLDRLLARDPSFAPWLIKERALIERDVNAVCAEFHDREEATVRALKITSIWEPSPFPAELPASEREAVIEPGFPEMPWPATPGGLLAHPPTQRGEIRFGANYILRSDAPLLLEPMTAEAGRKAYRSHEPLVATQRLADGNLVLAIMQPSRAHQSWIDQAPPEADPIGRYTRLLIYGGMDMAEITLWRLALRDEPLSIRSIDIQTKDRRRQIWRCNFSLEEAMAIIFDDREGPQLGVRHDLSTELCSVLALPHPVPGEFDDVIWRMRRLLDAMGYGELKLDQPVELS